MWPELELVEGGRLRALAIAQQDKPVEKVYSLVPHLVHELVHDGQGTCGRQPQRLRWSWGSSATVQLEVTVSNPLPTTGADAGVSIDLGCQLHTSMLIEAMLTYPNAGEEPGQGLSRIWSSRSCRCLFLSQPDGL